MATVRAPQPIDHWYETAQLVARISELERTLEARARERQELIRQYEHILSELEEQLDHEREMEYRHQCESTVCCLLDRLTR